MTSTLANIPPAAADFGGIINARHCDGNPIQPLSPAEALSAALRGRTTADRAHKTGLRRLFAAGSASPVRAAKDRKPHSAQMRAIRAGRTPADGGVMPAELMKGLKGSASVARFIPRDSDLLPAGCACPTATAGASVPALFEG